MNSNQKPKLMVVVKPDNLQEYLEAYKFVNKNPLASYVQKLENQLPIILNSKALTTNEKLDRYKRIMQKLNAIAQSRYDNEIAQLKQEERIVTSKEQKETQTNPAQKKKKDEKDPELAVPQDEDEFQETSEELPRPSLPPPQKIEDTDGENDNGDTTLEDDENDYPAVIPPSSGRGPRTGQPIIAAPRLNWLSGPNVERDLRKKEEIKAPEKFVSYKSFKK